MRSLYHTITAYIFVISSVFAGETPSAFMGKWLEAFDKNDAQHMSSFYDQSEKTECLVSLGVWLKGYEEIKSMYEYDMKSLRFHDSNAEGLQERVIGGMAVVSFIHKFKYQVRNTGVTYKIHIRTTATLRKQAKSWKIISEHSSPIKGIQRATLVNPVKNGKGANFKHLILRDEPTDKIAQSLDGRLLKDIKIKGLNVRKSLEYMLDSGAVRKGNYGSLVLLYEKSLDKVVSIENLSMSMADCIEEICQQVGLKWTIYFYAGQVEYPMLVVGSEETIMQYKRVEKNVKKTIGK